jgi:glycerol-3-phosphate dehydrogenase
MVEVADPDAAERNEMDVARIVRNEMAVHLDDVLVRRTPLLTETVDHGVGESVGVARTMAAEMGWDVVTRDSELVRYREVVEAHRRWKEGE